MKISQVNNMKKILENTLVGKQFPDKKQGVVTIIGIGPFHYVSKTYTSVIVYVDHENIYMSTIEQIWKFGDTYYNLTFDLIYEKNDRQLLRIH